LSTLSKNYVDYAIKITLDKSYPPAFEGLFVDYSSPDWPAAGMAHKEFYSASIYWQIVFNSIY
jgi:hypothetical protein